MFIYKTRFRGCRENRSIRKNFILTCIAFFCFCMVGSLYRRKNISVMDPSDTPIDTSFAIALTSVDRVEESVLIPPNEGQSTTASVKTGYKSVLMWNQWAGMVNSNFSLKNQPNWMRGCPEFRCLFLTSRDNPENADAILFNMGSFTDLNDIPLQKTRRQQQYYVFHLHESPDRMRETRRPWYEKGVLNNFFNITINYRSDADITDSYLHSYHPHLINLTVRHRDPLWFHAKKEILWFVSHCKTNSKREEYVKSLSLYLKIDTFGRCGSPDPCDKKKDCVHTLMPKYKFYLSFENSICKEYATEKLMRALNYDVVPIVLGGADYSSFLPESAFINVEDFESPKKLADYLITLIGNQTLYERHLQWKYPGQAVWSIPGSGKRDSNRFCQLCEILHRSGEKKIQRIYPSVQDWFFNETQCRKPYVRFQD